MPIRHPCETICAHCREDVTQHEQETKKCLFDATHFRAMTPQEYSAVFPGMEPDFDAEDERRMDTLIELWYQAGMPD